MLMRTMRKLIKKLVTNIGNWVAVWLSGSALVLINLCRAWLILGWVTVSRVDFRGTLYFGM